MNRIVVILLVLLAAVFCATVAGAYPTYFGYSGAPGTNGTCSSTCHGTPGGSIQLTGFPLTYELGDTYEIQISVGSVPLISNFNGSVRVGSDTTTAGLILPGTGTFTYYTPTEPMGVHFVPGGQLSGTFYWVAPDSNVGDVTLYLGGHQGPFSSGRYTTFVLVSSPLVGIEEPKEPWRAPHGNVVFSLQPTLVDVGVTFRARCPSGQGSLRVVSAGGAIVARIPVSGTDWAMKWQPVGRDGRKLARGTYIAELVSGDVKLARRFSVR
jgi:hypothetical protein